MSKKRKKNAPFIKKLSNFFGVNKELEAEKLRLESFLGAIPGEYCGWSRNDETMAFSPDFPKIFGLESIQKIDDIEGRLAPGDAAALEGLFNHLEVEGEPFKLNIRSYDESKTLRITGARGGQTDNSKGYNILWVEDITQQMQQINLSVAEKNEQERKIQQFSTALDHLPAASWLRNNEQELIWCNTPYCEILGISTGEVLSQQREITSPPRKKKKQVGENALLPGKDLAAAAIKSSETKTAKAHVTTQGKRLWMKFFEIPMPALNMTLGIARDITDEEKIETSLKRFQSANKELLEQLQTAIAIYDIEHRLEFYNSAFSELWNLDGGWLNTSPTLSDIMEKLRETRRLPEQADFRSFKKSWISMFTDLIAPHEDMLHLPDGSALRMLAIPNPLGGLMMTFEDVTSRLELESSYNTLVAVQNETLDNLMESVAVYGSDGRLRLSNPAFGRLWNLNPEDLENQPHISRIVEKTKSFFEEKDWPKQKEEQIALGLDRLMHEGRYKRTDNKLIDYTTVPLPDGGVLITYSDATDTVRIENALREKNKALETAERLKLDFLANMSYQLRTPLNAIMGFNEILDQEYFGPLNKRQKTYTHDMRDASTKLLELINDILDLSTIEAGYMVLERTEFDVQNMLKGITTLIQEWARKEHIEVTLSCPKNVGTIKADEQRIKQAIVNLVRNSISFTPENGKITLTAKRTKEGINIIVSDTGSGIQKEDQLRIMAPFERAQNQTIKGKMQRGGAGLGLSLVKNIMSLHEGSIELKSKPGKGTDVTLFLPHAKTGLKIKTPAKKKAAAK